ncbi:MAG: GyrI-like domain-containing protein [Candidatus Berkiella sp.]|jgi:predicted transcriptional regulator YdeE
MQKKQNEMTALKLVGITVRTNNKNEMNPKYAKIGELAERYWGEGLANQLQNRVNPGKTFAVYTEYESDERGDYTYFIGEEVSHFDEMPLGFTQLNVPAQKYQQFTTEPGAIPEVIINAWRQIWMMGEKELGGKRVYQADLEVIDVKNLDPEKAVFDIYIGIK